MSKSNILIQGEEERDKEAIERNIVNITHTSCSYVNYKFTACTIRDSVFAECLFSFVSFINCIIPETTFYNCVFTNVKFVECCLQGSILRPSEVSNLSILNCDITDIVLPKTNTKITGCIIHPFLRDGIHRSRVLPASNTQGSFGFQNPRPARVVVVSRKAFIKISSGVSNLRSNNG